MPGPGMVLGHKKLVLIGFTAALFATMLLTPFVATNLPLRRIPEMCV